MLKVNSCGHEDKNSTILFHGRIIFFIILEVTSHVCVLPTRCTCVFCIDLRINSDYSAVHNKLSFFITETECVYCAVRTEPSNIIYVIRML
jgi:hypothetical protein